MKVSIHAQIEEVEYELQQRKEVYARLVASRKMRQSVAELHIARMEAVRGTLIWLRNNGPKIRDVVSAGRGEQS